MMLVSTASRVQRHRNQVTQHRVAFVHRERGVRSDPRLRHHVQEYVLYAIPSFPFTHDAKADLCVKLLVNP